MPKWVTVKFKEMILRFLWNGKPAEVKYSALINE
jgi:multidrug resistance efflux pump